jgi:hypothetical protein
MHHQAVSSTLVNLPTSKTKWTQPCICWLWQKKCFHWSCFLWLMICYKNCQLKWYHNLFWIQCIRNLGIFLSISCPFRDFEDNFSHIFLLTQLNTLYIHVHHLWCKLLNDCIAIKDKDYNHPNMFQYYIVCKKNIGQMIAIDFEKLQKYYCKKRFVNNDSKTLELNLKNAFSS